MTMKAFESGIINSTKSVTLVAGANTVNFNGGVGVLSWTRLSEIQLLSDKTVIALPDAKVVSVNSGIFAGNAIYIQESDRTSGIKVMLQAGQSVTAGNGITLTGTILTDANGERYIQCDTIDSNDGSTTAPSALGIANKAIDGRLGTLVKVWGKVATTGTGFVYVDDGSMTDDGTGNGFGVRVSTASTTKTIGAFLSVTGIVGKTTGQSPYA